MTQQMEVVVCSCPESGIELRKNEMNHTYLLYVPWSSQPLPIPSSKGWVKQQFLAEFIFGLAQTAYISGRYEEINRPASRRP